MQDREILKEAIEKAIKNGYRPGPLFHCVDRYRKEVRLSDYGDYVCCKSHHYHIIFSHDFAKAFWGDEKLYESYLSEIYIENGIQYPKETTAPGIDAWKYHLQQMILREDPIRYLEKFL